MNDSNLHTSQVSDLLILKKKANETKRSNNYDHLNDRDDTSDASKERVISTVLFIQGPFPQLTTADFRFWQPKQCIVFLFYTPFMKVNFRVLERCCLPSSTRYFDRVELNERQIPKFMYSLSSFGTELTHIANKLLLGMKLNFAHKSHFIAQSTTFNVSVKFSENKFNVVMFETGTSNLKLNLLGKYCCFQFNPC